MNTHDLAGLIAEVLVGNGNGWDDQDNPGQSYAVRAEVRAKTGVVDVVVTPDDGPEQPFTIIAAKWA